MEDFTPKIFTPLTRTVYFALSITFKNSNLVLAPLPINLKVSAGLRAVSVASVSCLTSTSNNYVKLSVGAVKLITNFTITVPSLYCTNSSVSVRPVGAET